MANSKHRATPGAFSASSADVSNSWAWIEHGVPEAERRQCQRTLVRSFLAGEGAELWADAIREFRTTRADLKQAGSWDQVSHYYCLRWGIDPAGAEFGKLRGRGWSYHQLSQDGSKDSEGYRKWLMAHAQSSQGQCRDLGRYLVRMSRHNMLPANPCLIPGTTSVRSFVSTANSP